MKLAFLILSTLAFGSVAAAEDQVIIVGTISKLAHKQISVRVPSGFFVIPADDRTEVVKEKTYRDLSPLAMRSAFTAAILPESPLRLRFGRTSSRFQQPSNTSMEMKSRSLRFPTPTTPKRNTGLCIFTPTQHSGLVERIYRSDEMFGSSAWTLATGKLMPLELHCTTPMFLRTGELENEIHHCFSYTKVSTGCSSPPLSITTMRSPICGYTVRDLLHSAA